MLAEYASEMALLRFTQNLQRHLSCPDTKVPGNSVASCLASFFQQNPKARSYILTDQGELRKHMNIFINSEQVLDRRTLTDQVSDDDEIFILQALSGGL